MSIEIRAVLISPGPFVKDRTGISIMAVPRIGHVN